MQKPSICLQLCHLLNSNFFAAMLLVIQNIAGQSPRTVLEEVQKEGITVAFCVCLHERESRGLERKLATGRNHRKLRG